MGTTKNEPAWMDDLEMPYEEPERVAEVLHGEECPGCDGSGIAVGDLCPLCGGEGYEVLGGEMSPDEFDEVLAEQYALEQDAEDDADLGIFKALLGKALVIARKRMARESADIVEPHFDWVIVGLAFAPAHDGMVYHMERAITA